jgi:hypothetical protein
VVGTHHHPERDENRPDDQPYQDGVTVEPSRAISVNVRRPEHQSEEQEGGFNH